MLVNACTIVALNCSDELIAVAVFEVKRWFIGYWKKNSSVCATRGWWVIVAKKYLFW